MSKGKDTGIRATSTPRAIEAYAPVARAVRAGQWEPDAGFPLVREIHAMERGGLVARHDGAEGSALVAGLGPVGVRRGDWIVYAPGDVVAVEAVLSVAEFADRFVPEKLAPASPRPDGTATYTAPGLGVGIRAIAAERARQIVEEGFDASVDDGWTAGELSLAGALMAQPGLREVKVSVGKEDGEVRMSARDAWPWTDCDNRARHDPRRRLEIAGALIAAELDRLARAATRKAGEE